MTHFTERNLHQVAVYWGAPVNDGYGGFTWEEPVEIDCRWEESTKVLLTAKGEEQTSRAEVQVMQDVDENGILYLGTLADLDSGQEDDPTTIEGAYRILRFDKIPTIDGLHFFRKAYL